MSGIASSVFAALSLGFVALFTRSYLFTKMNMRLIHQIVTIELFAIPLILVLDLFFNGFRYLALIGGFSVLVTLLAAGIIAQFRKQQNSGSYLLSMSFFIIGAACSLVTNIGIRPLRFTYLFESAVQAGVVCSLLFFAVAISRRISDLRSEREHLVILNTREKAEKDQLREVARAKANLLASASHELRTPLSNIRLPIEGIIRGRYGNAIASSSRLFFSILAQVDRLSHHVNNLLTKSKIDFYPGELRYRRIYPVQMLEDLIRAFDARARQEEVELTIESEIDGACVCEADETLLSTAFDNLLDNALRYTPAGGVVSVRIEHANDRPEPGIRIPISDNGPGIHDTEDEAVSPDHSSAGLGLGISLARQIIDLHSGSFSIESEEENGTTCMVILPCMLIPGPNPHDPPVESTDTPVSTQDLSIDKEPSKLQTTTKVLVVDDDRTMTKHLANLLEERFSVSCVVSAKGALEMIQREIPDLILADVMMPGMDGVEFCRRIKEDVRTSLIPVVFLTARVDHQDAVRGLQAGAVDYIRKPFDGDELLEKLDSIQRSQRASLERQRQLLINHIRSWTGSESDTTREQEREFDLENARTRHDLTAKQLQVLDLVTKGYTDREVGNLLGISHKTVSYHVSNILEKLGVERRTQLTHELITNRDDEINRP
jgi:DNA-binding NarL/FixJ family response regulator/signal transduction histidine kinase